MATHNPMANPVTPWVLAGRILSIIGMGFTAAAGILLAIIPSWWALVCAGAFVPFFVLIVLVEKFSSRHGLIGPEAVDSSPE
jgi:membrane protein YqaA with SNARE-associated domain